MLRRFRCFVFVVLLALAGCSGSTAPEARSDRDAPTAASAAEVAASEQEPGSVITNNDTNTGVDSSAAAAAQASSPPPVEAFDASATQPATDIDPTSAWISRRSMSSSAIELVWSAPEGSAEYQVHRVPGTSDMQPDDSEMSAENLIHTGDFNGVHVDDAVTEGTRYWYGVRGLDADGAVVSTGWHLAAAITDDEPPAQVELTAEQTDGSVLLSWNQPAENYELHSYRILRAVGNEEPEVVASTWDINQTSFIDDDPPDELVTYSVIAFDFHWNGSEPSEVTLDRS